MQSNNLVIHITKSNPVYELNISNGFALNSPKLEESLRKFFSLVRSIKLRMSIYDGYFKFLYPSFRFQNYEEK